VQNSDSYTAMQDTKSLCCIVVFK